MQAMDTERRSVRMVPSAKRVRTYLGGQVVADTIRPLLVWEERPYPAYYFPLADVRAELLPDGQVRHSPERGDGQLFTVKAGGKEARGAALRYLDSPVEELRDLIRFEWAAMDAWFEEDEEVFTHPRSPYTRIDILASSRHVQVRVDGVTIADSGHTRLLFETGLPVRYYFPKPHVRMDLLLHSDKLTTCPYKGQAEYWSVRGGDTVYPDVAWSYRSPLPESQKIASMVAFYNERVDISVDGVLQERPITHFS
jgi:uncharacterized protein (DUF427 family)